MVDSQELGNVIPEASAGDPTGEVEQERQLAVGNLSRGMAKMVMMQDGSVTTRAEVDRMIAEGYDVGIVNDFNL